MYFAIQQEHKKLTVTVSSEIEKTAREAPEINLYGGVSWQNVKELTRQSTAAWLDVQQYIPETAFTTVTPEIKAYAAEFYRPGVPMFDATHQLMERIYRDFEFRAGFTTISTPLTEVMKEGKGVCQDFAHLAIACARSVGLPARYISGYLETTPPPGKQKLAGADASHAWFAVYIPYMGWIEFDPTNNQMPDAHHITACWGRDYADIAPLKGVIINSGPHQLSVSVDVKRIA